MVEYVLPAVTGNQETEYLVRKCKQGRDQQSRFTLYIVGCAEGLLDKNACLGK